MKIEMRVQLTGTRDGVEWPAPGGVVDVPDGEAELMIGQGLATPLAAPLPPVEKATRRPKTETAIRTN